MPKGYNGVILIIDLSSGNIEKKAFSEDFYRLYMGGGAFGAYFLLAETTGVIDPLGDENILTIAPSITTGCNVTGVSRCSAVAISPLTGAIGEGQAGGNIGPIIKHAGYDAIVLKGKSKTLSYIYIEDDLVEIRDGSHLRQKNVSDVYDLLIQDSSKRKTSIIQCGPAGEKCVRFASLLVDRNNVVGRTGMGAVMGSKGVRAIVVKSENKTQFHDNNSLKSFNQILKDKIDQTGFPRILKEHGTPGVVSIQANGGNLASYNYRSGFHKGHHKLDASSFEKEIGAGKATCPGCIVACRKRVKAESPYKVSDKLGGPEFETLSILGSNLDITDAVAVAKANELCNEFGLDTITTGAIAGYLFESIENNAIESNVLDGKTFRFGNAQDLFDLIDLIAKREGVGDILADGFYKAIEKLGEKTAPYAIHCKGQGLPAHLAQVKPSQALMYAACPIGGDHQSAEHDWFLNREDQDSRALGIFGEGDAKSNNLAKVRMTVYGQMYYSVLDTLTLCMFTWGPGNLFSYQDLVNLVSFTTGWKTTMWELMKVGERKINMMKAINIKRGFTVKDDILPDRLYDPIPDGPSAGSCVNRDRFPDMLKEYYGLMGWDPETGKPTTGKLQELGLDWVAI
ncbi:hypothetical protein KJ966_26420 [bacterium]|nr:hypothetical protein [bacterium]